MQWIGYVAGLTALAVAALAFAVRRSPWLPLTHLAFLAMAAAAPCLALGAPATLVVFAIQRRWTLVTP